LSIIHFHQVELFFEGMNDPDNEHCKAKDIWAEDLQIGYCFQSLQIPPADTTDSFGMARFFAHHPMIYTFPGVIFNNQFLLTTFQKRDLSWK
jgi:hypothetical protein